MSNDYEQRFYEGDVLEIRGGEYEVTAVDVGTVTGGRPLQYRLEARNDAPPALLETAGDSSFVLKQWREVDPTVIE